MRVFNQVPVSGLTADSSDVDDHVEFWAKKDPLFYSRLTFNPGTYYLLQTITLGLIAGSFFFFPASHLVLAFILAYPLGYTVFCMGHTIVHARYLESPLEDWEPGVVVAWLHHYDHPGVISKHWCIHRLAFLIGARSASFITYAAAWILPYILFGNAIAPLYFMYLLWFSSGGPAHEFVHTPVKSRRENFSWLMHTWLSILFFVGLADEKEHTIHHALPAGNDDHVEKFGVLELPIADRTFDAVWRIALRVRDWGWFKKTPIRKALYLQGSVIISLLFVLTAWFFVWVTGGGAEMWWR